MGRKSRYKPGSKANYVAKNHSNIGKSYVPYDGVGSFELWLYEQLIVAFYQARKGKRKTHDEHDFELYQYENILQLTKEIVNHEYWPGDSTSFMVHKPIDREIFAAHFRDRVVHHFLYNAVAWWWDRRLVSGCFSCRVGKGTWYGVSKLAGDMRKVTRNGTKKAYVIKLDIQGYFMSLKRDKLYERICWGLDRQFPQKNILYHTLKYLWHQIIMDDAAAHATIRGSLREWRNLRPSKSLYCQEPGRGIVIGNLTSQLLSNIYLDQLDRYIRYTLGYKYYGRYVDDFYILVSEEDYAKAKRDVAKIERFLKDELDLVLHPKKRYFQEVSKGVAFLGAVVYPHNVVPGKRVVHNFYKSVYNFTTGHGKMESVVSYAGFMKNLDGETKSRQVLTRFDGSGGFGGGKKSLDRPTPNLRAPQLARDTTH